jgi:hypothetical protein
MTFDEVQTAGKAGTEVLFNGQPHKVVKYMQATMIRVQPVAGGPAVPATAEQLTLA